MGKPLIVSNRGGLPELVEDGVNGYIYDNTSDKLAECIGKLQQLTDSSYQSMAQESLKKASALFSSEQYVTILENRCQEWKQ